MANENEAGRLRKLARDWRTLIWLTGHGGEEGKKDAIPRLDIFNMLKRCVVTQVEINAKSGEEEWRAEGKDGDGRGLTAIVVVDERADPPEIKVVTTWAK